MNMREQQPTSTPIIFRILAALVWTPIVKAFEIGRALVTAPVSTDAINCGTCSARVSLLGFFQCGDCSFSCYGWFFAECELCGSVPPFVDCDRCGASIKNPFLGGSLNG